MSAVAAGTAIRSGDALAMLAPRDWELLARHMVAVDHGRGDVLLQEGVHRRALLIVRSGVVRVERTMQGQAIVLAQLGAGEVLGDIGFIATRRPAHRSWPRSRAPSTSSKATTCRR